MTLSKDELERMRNLAREHVEEVATLTQRICRVPAPTGSEQQRAAFVTGLFEERSYQCEHDEVGNVYVRRGRGTGPVLLLLAHLDTVFPQDTPLNVRREGDVLYGPGIGDNSLSVASMLTLLKMLDLLKQETPIDIVAVANVGEEGLGNLRGARAAVERYKQQLGAVIAIDGNLGYIVNEAVGSLRWRITVNGPGGHSYGAFGRPSAIHGLARIIARISEIQVPKDPKTTYNVGVIDGGTSVNTIAASASALLDMRSTDVQALDRLANEVRAIVKTAPGEGLQGVITIIGERPAGKIASDAPLVHLAQEALRWIEIEPRLVASSTDVNIPLSQGIPAVCVGVSQGRQAHTLEEWVPVAPIADGLAQLLYLITHACEQLAR
ncbi:M20/M25/M40 family metallo-hydrolase [Ktedonobacter racemifer]|uniref:Peptidase dimerization domain protein n=1 Tax=Ktedonobacter racemifer DSM 44963 TaxID=485913 RepID=D6U6U7_KTERA|nr:M20/M25/M40 family metallo-hydrolase [Ktedonobacter racemifer]EFH80708.1 peptidase dimerization domain protein [Ktedonobacter racemifer DSM 44963]